MKDMGHHMGPDGRTSGPQPTTMAQDAAEVGTRQSVELQKIVSIVEHVSRRLVLSCLEPLPSPSPSHQLNPTETGAIF